MLKFVKDQPAIFIEEESILVIGDLHLGLTYRLYMQGINLPDQVSSMRKRIEKLLRKTGAKNLVILGDLKDEVPGINYTETFEIPKFLSSLSRMAKIIICKGNHDTHLEKIIPEDITIHQARGFSIKKYFFQHGHEWPSSEFLKCDYLISSHIHPVLEFRDEFGYKVSRPVWVKATVEKKKFQKRYKIKEDGTIEINIIPSFNPLLGGYPINRIREIERISPIFRKDIIDPEKTELYLLDGTYIGTVKDIKN